MKNDDSIDEEEFPYPIHDWMDESHYIKERTNREWGWEFLRRNKNYQFDSTRFAMNLDFSEYDIIIDSSDHAFDTRFVKLPDKIEGLITKKGIIPLQNVIAEKYNFKSTSNLSYFKTDLLENDSFLLMPQCTWMSQSWFKDYSSTQIALAPIKESDYVVRFDLEASIEKQIKHIKRSLTAHAKRSGITEFRVTKDKYVIYLRLLDGIAENKNITNIELAKVLCDEKTTDTDNAKSNIRNWKIASKKITDSDYIRLMAS